MAHRTLAGLVVLFAPAAAAVIYRNTAPGVAYVGSRACAGCHPQIYRSYQRTEMGHSISPAAVLEHLEKAARPVTVSQPKFNRLFQIFRENGALYQSESEPGVFKNVQRLEYAVGSGVNGYTYLVRRGNYLFQAPLSYYSRPAKWDLSPGYEFADNGFSRPVVAACLACHSGRPQPVPGRNGLYRDPPFRELSIGCENCHGPGALHVAERAKGVHLPGSIVNPAKLEPRLAEDICMYCHQGGDTRVLQPGRDYADFRPGTWLNDTLAILKIDSGLEDSDLLEHHSAMRASRCFSASDGKLSCLTCHDPHRSPSGAEALAWYRGKCLQCHTEKSCNGATAARIKSSDDCAGCHMPKREVGVISHAALTNHAIPAIPGQVRGTAAPDAHGLIHVNQPPDGRPLDGITLLKAYGDLMQKDPRYQTRYLELLDQVAGKQPDEPFVQAALGRKALRETAPDAVARAVAHLSRAIELGFAGSTAFEDLAEALSRQGHLEEAVKILQRGIALEPYSPVLYKSLALRYINLKHYSEARNTMRRYVELFPEDDFMRGLLNKVETSPEQR